ncbi:MAG: autotransporter-associated beta strand repeat-containing protein [Bacteroidetes bacterium]|nr:autotransporter-associated beta strand repeat-containing protein [Bacteroidota bacterium]
MKKILQFTSGLIFGTILFVLAMGNEVIATGTDYYYKGSGSLATLSNWGTNLDGSGTAPASFINGDIFNLRNTSSVILDATWDITTSTLLVGDGATGMTLTIPADYELITLALGKVQVNYNSTLILQNTTKPNIIDSDVTSTVDYQVPGGGIDAAKYGNLTISGSGTFNLNGNTEINGTGTGFVIGPDALFQAGSNTLGVKATYWTNNGTYMPNAEIVTFNGTTPQTIGGTHSTAFYSLTISSPTANVMLANNISIENMLTITSGILDLSTFTCNRTTPADYLTLSLADQSSAQLRMSGSTGGLSGSVNFNNTSLGAASTVEYYGTAQTVAPLTYGKLTLSGSGIKTAGGALTVNTVLTVKNNVTLALGTYNLGTPTGVVLECGAITGSSITGTSGTLTLGGNVTVNSAGTGSSGATISAPIALGSSTRTFTVADDGTSAADLTIDGIISGTYGITKSGYLSTLVLSGNNTYSGLTTISYGILKLGAAGDGTNTPLGTAASGTSIASPSTTGAVLDLNGYTLSTSETLTLNKTGIDDDGALINSSATAVSYSGLIDLGSSSSIVANAGDINITNAGTILGSSKSLTLGGSGNGSISSIIGTVSGLVTKNGTGTWTLSGSSTYTGTTTINAGTLKLGAAGDGTNTPTGTVAGGISITAGAVFDLNGYTLSTTEALTIRGTGISSGGALINSSGTSVTYSGLISLGSASSIMTNAGDINITNAGTVSGSYALTLGGSGNGSISSIIGIGTSSLTKTGTGTWTLSGANTYTGVTTISEGTLKLGASERIGNTSDLTVNGTFDLGGYSETVAALSGSGTITSSAAGSLTLTAGDADNTTYSGVIQNGSATVSFTKAGGGILTLTGNNIYTGTTTISAGTLRLGAANVLPDYAVTLSGGTLSTGSGAGFSETIGTLELSATSTIALGTGVHTLTMANSSGITWAGTTLNITGWTGLAGADGTATAGKIIVGVGGLTAGQLAKITFSDGCPTGAVITASGELVPNTPTVYYSQGNVDPSTLSNWNTARGGGGSSPANFTSGNVFVVQNGHSMTTSAVWSVSGINSRVLIENGGTLISTSAITLAAATYFQIDNGGTYKHQNGIAYGGSIFQGTEVFGSSSTVELNNSNITGPSGVAFGNLIVNFTSTPSGNVNCQGGLTIINGSLTIQNTSTVEFRLTGSTALSLDIAGNLSVTGGTFNLSTGSSNSQINLKGNFTHTAGTITESGSGSGTFVFNGTGTQTYTSGGTVTNTVNFTVNSGSTVQMADAGTIISGGGAFTLSSGATLGIKSTVGITTTGATGNIQVTGTRTFNSGANYLYNGADSQNTGTGLSQNTPANLTIDNANTVSLSAATAISGNLMISQGTLSTSASNFGLSVGGNFTNNGSFSAGTSTVTLNGSSSQNIGGSSVPHFHQW